jgi:hypothetical protein
LLLIKERYNRLLLGHRAIVNDSEKVSKKL